MKIISLNVWGGRIDKKLFSFLESRTDVDVFCFQEVYHEANGKDVLWTDSTRFDLLNDFKKILKNYQCFYHPHLGDWWGLALFVRNTILVEESGEVFVHKEKGHNFELETRGHTAKNLQYVKIDNGTKKMYIINFHGLWNGQGKTDTKDRIIQSQNIIDFIKMLREDFLLCGDFNLLPDTQSLQMIESFGLRNLIKEYRITSTRTSFYTKPARYADYAFVTKGLNVVEFTVLPDEVSDHAPLYIEIQL